MLRITTTRERFLANKCGFGASALTLLSVTDLDPFATSVADDLRAMRAREAADPAKYAAINESIQNSRYGRLS